ncbi:unnamed protein product [Lymnaea stagnalis]|uniref:Transient receptor potential cation channel subfamily M member 3 n=1 Tax=Lymnaea stagnalis TaxID=6523 RepID=A0AAV2H583_LYMST
MSSSAIRVHPSSFGVGPGATSLSMQSALSENVSQSSGMKSTLEKAYLTGRQRQMGLKQKRETIQDDEYQKRKELQIAFIKDKFRQKECRIFVPVPGQCGDNKQIKAKHLKCHCGEVLMLHAGMRLKSPIHPYENRFLLPPEYDTALRNLEKILTEPLPTSSREWKEAECFYVSPTNAFGKIEFNVEQVGGKKPAKYIRICADDSDNVDNCLELMKNFWHMMNPEPPHLVISVVGGAKNFKLDGRMRDTFTIGLIKAAKTTNAWLITSGFNMGVMKAVGQAVHEGQTFQWDNDRMNHVLRCIGIAPWGYVKGRHVLESYNGQGKFNAFYRTSNQILHKQPVPLNPDHTHFIFVDDGYRYRYGGVADFRSKFERKIATEKSEGGLGIPLVLLLVEGGTDAIQDVSVSLAEGIPVVVCAGTGRAADILAYAFKNTITQNTTRSMSDFHQDKLARKIYAAYKTTLKPGKEKEELESLKEKVMGCCQREDLVIVFNMNKHEDLDLAILKVLLKVKTNSSLENQLKLALTWNRADIAQEEIFREDVIWKEGSLEEFLTQALVENKVDFVKLMLNNGIIMQEYLTIQRLEHLYNSMPKHCYLYLILKNFAKEDKFNVDIIEKFTRSLLDRFDNDTFSKPGDQEPKGVNKIASSMIVPHIESDSENRQEPNRFKRPYKQLLIWAILMDRFNLAQLFWELGSEPITSALICTVLCHRMEIKVPKYLTIVRNSFHAMKDEFEQLAISVLNECHNVDPDKSIMLIQRKSPTWGGMTCLQIAASASDQAFVSSVACQNSINNVWKNGIEASWPKVFCGAILPPFILAIDISLFGQEIKSKLQKIITFYSAPLTKFSMYTAAYLAFLGLFTYMILVDFRENPSPTEWIILIWIISFIIGGIHSFIVFPSPTFSGKWRDFFGVMDRLDFLNLLLAIIAFILRWFQMYDAKVIYCVNAVIFYIRVMKLYTANRRLGPKIYMINRMLVELALFVMVLMVFLLAYGVASQGLLYKNRNKDWIILKDILYFPYWQLFGEIFFDELETDSVCQASLTATLNITGSNDLPDELNTCRTSHWLVPLLLAMYLLVGNVLLLNLLIAIFSHVFDTVENNAIEIWKFQMYFLVMEFQNRPLLFPPFSIFSYFLYAVRYIWRKVSHQKKVKSEQFLKHHLEFLSVFEKEMMANKLRAVKANILQSIDMKFHILQTRMDELTRVIEDELMSDQHNIIPGMELNKAPTMVEEIVNAAEQNDLLEAVQTDSTELKKKHKHKHKHRRKKRNEDMPPISEEKKLNIDVADEVKKGHHAKEHLMSDEENQSPPQRHSSLNVNPPMREVTTTPRGVAWSGTGEPKSPSFSQRLNYFPMDSDEEEIPTTIYSPRATSTFNVNLSPSHGTGSDSQSDNEEVSSHTRRRQKARLHLKRHRTDASQRHNVFSKM